MEQRKVDASTSPIAPPWNDSSLPTSSPDSVPVCTPSVPSGSNVSDHTFISSVEHVFDTSIVISSSILIDYSNVFHTLQSTSSETIFGNAENATLPVIVPRMLKEEGRKVRNIGSVGREEVGGRDGGQERTHSVDDPRNGGIGGVDGGGISGIEIEGIVLDGQLQRSRDREF